MEKIRLNRKIASTEASIKIQNNVVKVREKAFKDATNTLKQLKEQFKLLKIEKNKLDGFEISEHSIIRYLERVRGIDIEEIKSEILSPMVVEECGDGNTNVDCGEYTVIMKNKIVITIQKNKNGDN